MTHSSIAAHREGQLVAIETLISDADYKGIANTSYLDAEAAIRLGEALAAWGRQILARPVRNDTVSLVPHALKEMPMAVPSDPHAGD